MCFDGIWYDYTILYWGESDLWPQVDMDKHQGPWCQ